MKMKTEGLRREFRNWAVAKAEGFFEDRGEPAKEVLLIATMGYDAYDPVTVMTIMQRERITVRFWDNEAYVTAYYSQCSAKVSEPPKWVSGGTVAEAVIACYLHNVYGDEVDVP
jgi:hypothetical protein